MRQEVRGLVEKVDAQFVVGNADMDMQAADRQSPPDTLQILMQTRVPIAFGGLLRIPSRKGMCRRGDRRQTAPRRRPGNCPPQPSEIGAGLTEALTNPRSDLNLRAQKLWTYLPGEQGLALLQHFRRRIADDIARRAVDEKVFLLDTES